MFTSGFTGNRQFPYFKLNMIYIFSFWVRRKMKTFTFLFLNPAVVEFLKTKKNI